MFNDANIKLSQALTACDRVFEIFNWHSHIKEAENPVALGAFEKEIRLSDVHFAYPDAPQRLILKNVSFTIPKGKIIALVGASGAGKSSLVGLLPRLFDVTSGKIEIDGKDIRAASLTELRNHIAIVSQ
ncbi:MAG: ATP-binding cassette domain-containing protein, partial [Bdellovibrionota bacterium]